MDNLFETEEYIIEDADTPLEYEVEEIPADATDISLDDAFIVRSDGKWYRKGISKLIDKIKKLFVRNDFEEVYAHRGTKTRYLTLTCNNPTTATASDDVLYGKRTNQIIFDKNEINCTSYNGSTWLSRWNIPNSNIMGSNKLIGAITQRYTAQIPANTEVVLSSVLINRTGWYLVEPCFRCNINANQYAAARLVDNTANHQYDLGTYSDGIKMSGNNGSGQMCMNQVAIMRLIAGTTYYWHVKTNVAGGIETGTWNWYKIVLLGGN